jgi:hypothetical protein
MVISSHVDTSVDIRGDIDMRVENQEQQHRRQLLALHKNCLGPRKTQPAASDIKPYTQRMKHKLLPKYTVNFEDPHNGQL